MKTLEQKTINLIKQELESIPEKYQQNFNSTHEGYGVLMEEVKELEDQIFFGEKRARSEFIDPDRSGWNSAELHKQLLRKEAIQVAAMAIRFIQELT